MTSPLWQPSTEKIAQAAMSGFLQAVNKNRSLALKDDKELYDWSVAQYPQFWSEIWDFCGVIGDKGARLIENEGQMPGCKFFPDARLNYAENLLLAGGFKDSDIALYFWGEDKIKRQLTYAELRAQVSKFQQFLLAQGVSKGDRVAAFMPNMPETIIAMLAATSLGAIWSSTSPDFGISGVVDRFGQIEPKILIAIDGYYYNGKWVDCREKLQEIVTQIPNLQKTVCVSYEAKDIAPVANTVLWSDILHQYNEQPIAFTRIEFNHPLFIMFSSGTTGKPKCIVHGTGGTLLQHLKEEKIHCNIVPKDRFFYFTTCGWMMWNWLITGLACGATLCLYDGSPFAPDSNILFDYADAVDVTLFGTGAKYLDSLRKQNVSPKDTHKLKALRTITSTGSVLVPEGFDYVYNHIKKDVHLASICGGTDIIASFMLGYPTRAVWRGELQGAGLGFDLDAFTTDGKPCPVGEKGELVCKKPFVSMPVGFWNDPDGAKYRKAYFERFPGIWHHGDFVEKTPHNGFIVYGRSDATLNPGGVRIGTAEIYRQVEQLPEILESVVVGQKWDDDERVILFVTLAKDVQLNDDLITKIKKQIRSHTTPRHVPAKIVAVTDIPRTKNNKISEIAVRDVINGQTVANTDALANPQALNLYKDLPTLQTA